jgi:hypothetical protein
MRIETLRSVRSRTASENSGLRKALQAMHEAEWGSCVTWRLLGAIAKRQNQQQKRQAASAACPCPLNK